MTWLAAVTQNLTTKAQNLTTKSVLQEFSKPERARQKEAFFQTMAWGVAYDDAIGASCSDGPGYTSRYKEYALFFLEFFGLLGSCSRCFCLCTSVPSCKVAFSFLLGGYGC
jgi:hypothetical protein